MKNINRRGVSLIEMLVVISMLTTLMVFVGKMMYGLFQAEQASARDVLLDRRLSELALQFREDVHRAVSVAIVDESLHCTGPDDMAVTYTAAESHIDRTVSNSRHQPERYTLPGSRPVFQTTKDGAVELTITHSLPQVTYTPNAPHEGGTVVIRAVPNRYGKGATP